MNFASSGCQRNDESVESILEAQQNDIPTIMVIPPSAPPPSQPRIQYLQVPQPTCRRGHTRHNRPDTTLEAWPEEKRPAGQTFRRFNKPVAFVQPQQAPTSQHGQRSNRKASEPVRVNPDAALHRRAESARRGSDPLPGSIVRRIRAIKELPWIRHNSKDSTSELPEATWSQLECALEAAPLPDSPKRRMSPAAWLRSKARPSQSPEQVADRVETFGDLAPLLPQAAQTSSDQELALPAQPEIIWERSISAQRPEAVESEPWALRRSDEASPRAAALAAIDLAAHRFAVTGPKRRSLPRDPPPHTEMRRSAREMLGL